MKLLIVEDESKTGEYLRQGLTEAGFVVDLARTGLDDHHLAMTKAYDLILLDVMLPNHELRQRYQCDYQSNTISPDRMRAFVCHIYVRG